MFLASLVKEEIKMAVYEVNRLDTIDTTHYSNGDLFLTKQSIAIMHNYKIEPLVKQSEVKKMIHEEVKKVLKDNDNK